QIGPPLDLASVDYYKGERALDQLLPYMEAIFALPDFDPIETRLLKYFLVLPLKIHDWPFLERALGLEDQEEVSAYQQGLQNLVRLGLVSAFETGYQIHAMIQRVLEQELTVSWSTVEPWAHWLTRNLYIDGEDGTGDPARRFSWIPYGEQFMEIDIQAVDAAAMSILQSNLGMAYQSLYYYNEALYLLEKALNSDLETYGLGHPKVAIRQSNLGHLYKELAYRAEARELFEEAHAALQNHYGPDHPKVAISSANLGGSYQDEGNYPAAQALLEKALAIDLQHFGPKHPRTARSYTNLGALLWDADQKEAAFSRFQTAHQVFLEQLGVHHPHTQVVQSWLDRFQNR
ncbi:MAG: tetratricopeptide repeat protein, partial [Bacteroidota bacterium]